MKAAEAVCSAWRSWLAKPAGKKGALVSSCVRGRELQQPSKVAQKGYVLQSKRYCLLLGLSVQQGLPMEHPISSAVMQCFDRKQLMKRTTQTCSLYCLKQQGPAESTFQAPRALQHLIDLELRLVDAVLVLTHCQHSPACHAATIAVLLAHTAPS